MIINVTQSSGVRVSKGASVEPSILACSPSGSFVDDLGRLAN